MTQPESLPENTEIDRIRLTDLAHGGCGCKIAPSVLQELLSFGKKTPSFLPRQLLVGASTSDDAAVWLINERQAIVATTDFFMPIVDDPTHFGQIAATNAISDIYAMGATPLFALALVGMPLDQLPLDTVGEILRGGEEICLRAGIPIAGGHSVDSVEPIYGLVVIGMINPNNLKKNDGAQPGNKLILGKALGIGVYSAAHRRGRLDKTDYQTLVETATQLNTPGPALSCLQGVRALTDVTGFGLLGHVLEICRASNVAAQIDYGRLPFLPNVFDYVLGGFTTGASVRNWASYSESVLLDSSLNETERTLLTDPQTSGGLLVACEPEAVTQVLSIFLQQGFEHASVIGEIVAGEPGVSVVYSGRP